MSNGKKIIPGAYVKLSFEAKTEEGEIADSTKQRIKKNDEYEEIDVPIVVKIGEREVFFDDFLLDLEEGKEYDIKVPPEKAYGKRDPKRIETIPIKKLRSLTGERKFSVGQILYDSEGRYYGKIIYVGSRDITIDRNHPLAGKNILVHLKIHKVVLPSDPAPERLRMILERYLGEELTNKVKIDLGDRELEITFPTDILMRMSIRDLVRTVYLPRKTMAEEILRELSLDKVKFVEAFSLVEMPKIQASSIAPSTPVPEEGKEMGEIAPSEERESETEEKEAVNA